MSPLPPKVSVLHYQYQNLVSKKSRGPNTKPKIPVLPHIGNAGKVTKLNMIAFAKFALGFAFVMLILCCLSPFFHHIVT